MDLCDHIVDTSIDNALQQKGPVVRVAPDELAVNDIEVVETVHGYAQNKCTKQA